MTASAAVLDLYEAGMLAGARRRSPRVARSDGDALHARAKDGSVIELKLRRWLRAPSRDERRLLTDLPAPVLDVGCGPGRHVAALHARGVPALGVDVAPGAVRRARARGAPVLQRSVFETLPLTARWGSALLLDGNIGIAGNPDALLGRVADLLRPGGLALVEVEAPGRPSRNLHMRLEREGVVSDWFPWAVVGVDGIEALALGAGFSLDRLDTWRGRWFARLRRPADE